MDYGTEEENSRFENQVLNEMLDDLKGFQSK